MNLTTRQMMFSMPNRGNFIAQSIAISGFTDCFRSPTAIINSTAYRTTPPPLTDQRTLDVIRSVTSRDETRSARRVSSMKLLLSLHLERRRSFEGRVAVSVEPPSSLKDFARLSRAISITLSNFHSLKFHDLHQQSSQRLSLFLSAKTCS
jgi:hypothetical protein